MSEAVLQVAKKKSSFVGLNDRKIDNRPFNKMELKKVMNA